MVAHYNPGYCYQNGMEIIEIEKNIQGAIK